MESNTVVTGSDLLKTVVCPDTPSETGSRSGLDAREFEQMLQRASEMVKLRARRKQVAPE